MSPIYRQDLFYVNYKFNSSYWICWTLLFTWTEYIILQYHRHRHIVGWINTYFTRFLFWNQFQCILAFIMLSMHEYVHSCHFSLQPVTQRVPNLNTDLRNVSTSESMRNEYLASKFAIRWLILFGDASKWCAATNIKTTDDSHLWVEAYAKAIDISFHFCQLGI